MLVEALKMIPEENRPKGITADRGLPGKDDFAIALKRLLASALIGSDHSWHVIARVQIGRPGYRQMMDDLEAKDPERVAETVEPYAASMGRATQRSLF